MQSRFFYIGPREVNLLLQDGFRRAQKAMLIDERLSCYDIVPGLADHDRLNKSKFESLLRELWKEPKRAVIFFDTEYEKTQCAELTERLATSGVTVFPLQRPIADRENCDRTALMMMSTPLWTQACLRQAMSPDDTFLIEFERLAAERDKLAAQVLALEASKGVDSRTLAQIVADVKKEHHPSVLVITSVTEDSAKSCHLDDPLVAMQALEAIAVYVKVLRDKPGTDINLNAHFNVSPRQTPSFSRNAPGRTMRP